MDRIELGTVTAPSGRLVLVDAGLLGDPWPEVARFAVEVGDLPHDVLIAVVAEPMPEECGVTEWRRVTLEVRPGAEVAESDALGNVCVDCGSILGIDAAARLRWRHEESIDGLADLAFWGAEAAQLAASFDAPTFPAAGGDSEESDGVFGWRNLALEDAKRRAAALDARRETLGLHLPIDFRTHSDHWRALEATRRSRHDAGTIEVGGARACLFATSIGDGWFPVVRDVDASGVTVRVRIEICADE